MPRNPSFRYRVHYRSDASSPPSPVYWNVPGQLHMEFHVKQKSYDSHNRVGEWRAATSTDRNLRETVGDATNSAVAAASAAVLSEPMTARFSRTLTNAAPWS